MNYEQAEFLTSEGDDTAEIPARRLAADYLNNERTFLAWIRTSIAVISLGFVITKFGVWFSEIASRIDPKFTGIHAGASVPIGFLMMIFGGLLAGLSAWRYMNFNRQISRGDIQAGRGLIVFVTFLVVVLPIVMVSFLLVSPN